MFRKILTHLMIFTLTVLPVQVISAGVKNNTVKLSNMQMSMVNVTQAKHECMHALDESKNVSEMPCCEDSSHQCEGCSSCGDCAQSTSTISLLSMYTINSVNQNIQKIVSSHLSLNGIPQKNLIRPPRIII